MRTLAAPGLLPVRVAGPVDGRPVVLLHGFLADSRQWRTVTQLVDATVGPPIRWLLPDLPGHGRAAGRFPAQPGWDFLVDLLARSLAPHLRQPALLGGYSMGGRIAAVLAAAQRLELAGLWLESAHPPLDPDAARGRRAEDEARAQRLEANGIAAFVDDWQALALFASQQGLPRATREAQRRLRLSQQPAGLARSLRWYGTGTMPRDLRIATPTQLLAGALDPKLLARLTQWQPLVADLTCTIAPDAGHAVHLEQPSRAAGHLAHSLALAFPT